MTAGVDDATAAETEGTALPCVDAVDVDVDVEVDVDVDDAVGIDDIPTANTDDRAADDTVDLASFRAPCRSQRRFQPDFLFFAMPGAVDDLGLFDDAPLKVGDSLLDPGQILRIYPAQRGRA